jgi:hypothetical protein
MGLSRAGNRERKQPEQEGRTECATAVLPQQICRRHAAVRTWRSS